MQQLFFHPIFTWMYSNPQSKATSNCKPNHVYFATFLKIRDLTEQLFLHGKIHMNDAMQHTIRVYIQDTTAY